MHVPEQLLSGVQVVYNDKLMASSYVIGSSQLPLPSQVSTFEPVHEKTNNLGFRPGPTKTRLESNRPDTNQAVQSQHEARSLNLWIKVEEELHYPVAKTKRRSAFLFSHMQIVGFPMQWFIYHFVFFYLLDEVKSLNPRNLMI